MKFAFFPGCLSQTDQYGCELSVREVLPRMGVELTDLEGSACCGYQSFRVTSPLGWKYLSTRILSLSDILSLDVLTLCNNCNLSLTQVKRDLDDDEELRNLIQQTLSVEGFKYAGKSEVYHLLEVLHDKVGVDKISKFVSKPFKGFIFAAHPGCHAFRPTKLRRPDKGENPKKLNELIQVLGAESPDYHQKLDCCGAPAFYAQEKSSMLMAGSKLRSLREQGFDGLVTICTQCFKMYDAKQSNLRKLMHETNIELPVFYYTQLLGLSLGVSPEKLGLQLNHSPVEKILSQL